MLMVAPRLRLETEFLPTLSAVNRRRLLEGSTRAVYPAGSIMMRPGGPPVAFLLEQGLARAYWNLPDGRQATIAFVHPNELTGGAAIIGNSPWAFMQVITETTLTALDMKRARDLAKSEIEIAAAVSKHLAMRMRQADRLIAIRSLGNIRERLAYDLLDRAGRHRDGGGLQIRATQADLADSIGSSREVMSRALRDFRTAGVVATAPGLILIQKPAHLAAIVDAFVI
jgi:CRP/FNR family transcriptional regulator, cyclic AMP receptor protein